MGVIKISERLRHIASLLKKTDYVADIGTDHAYLPIYLMQSRECKHVYALDIRKGPLNRASENIRLYGLEEKITCRISDGLQNLADNEVDSIIISGMGGELIKNILAAGLELARGLNQLVLSPQSEPHILRAFLRVEGFEIEKEELIADAGKLYVLMRVKYLKENLETGVADESRLKTKLYDYFGEYLIKRRSSSLLDYLESEKCRVNSLLAELASKKYGTKLELRLMELNSYLLLIEEALYEMR